jgi:CBS domain-containing protein
MFIIRHILEVKGYDVWSVSPDTSVLDALRIMADKDVGVLMVMDKNQLVGVVSERDYARKIILKGKTSKDTPVRDIMSSPVITIHPDQTIDEAMYLMNARGIRHLPVVLDDNLMGVVSIRDVLRAIIYRQRQALREMEERVTGQPAA